MMFGILTGNQSFFTEFSLDQSPFVAADEAEEEIEEIIDSRGVRTQFVIIMDYFYCMYICKSYESALDSVFGYLCC